MSNPLASETFYEKYKSVIDPTAFITTSALGFEKLRSLEWINGPITQQGIAFSGMVNGLAIYLSYRIGNGDEQESPYIKSVLTLIGFALGAIAAPYVASKLLQRQAVLITPQMAFRIAGLNLVTKVFVYVTFTLAERQYNQWNFPLFQNLPEMSGHAVGLFYDRFKKHPDLWKKHSFSQQLAFNARLLEFKQEPLPISNIDLKASLTNSELNTFKTLIEGKELTPEQATILYKFHVPPENHRRYKVESLPLIDPRKVDVSDLSPAQVRWNHEWFVAHPELAVPQAQVQGFVPLFYEHDLHLPYERFVAELPFPDRREKLTSAKVSYLAQFYKAKEGEVNKKWSELTFEQQVFLKTKFRECGADDHPLKAPSISQMASMNEADLRDCKKTFKKSPNLWAVNSEDYQKAFNQALGNKGIKELLLSDRSMSTAKKVGIVIVVLGVITLACMGIAYRNRSTVDPDEDSTPSPPPVPVNTDTTPRPTPVPMTADKDPTPSPTPVPVIAGKDSTPSPTSSTDKIDQGNIEQREDILPDNPSILQEKDQVGDQGVLAKESNLPVCGLTPPKSNRTVDILNQFESSRIFQISEPVQTCVEGFFDFENQCVKLLDTSPLTSSQDFGGHQWRKIDADFSAGETVSGSGESGEDHKSTTESPSQKPTTTNVEGEREEGPVISPSPTQVQVSPDSETTVSGPRESGEDHKSATESLSQKSTTPNIEGAREKSPVSSPSPVPLKVRESREGQDENFNMRGVFQMSGTEETCVKGFSDFGGQCVKPLNTSSPVSATQLRGRPPAEGSKKEDQETKTVTGIKGKEATDTTTSDSSFGWAWAFPILGLALSIVYAVLHKRKKEREETVVPTTEGLLLLPPEQKRALTDSPKNKLPKAGRTGGARGTSKRLDFGASEKNEDRKAVTFEPDGTQVDFSCLQQELVTKSNLPALSQLVGSQRLEADVVGELATQQVELNAFIKVEPKADVYPTYASEDTPQIDLKHFDGIEIQRRDLGSGPFLDLIDKVCGPDNNFDYLTINASTSSSKDSRLHDTEFLEHIVRGRANPHIQMITLCSLKTITKEYMQKLIEKFPNAVYFDFRGCKVEEGLLTIRPLNENYIIILDGANLGNSKDRFEHYQREMESRTKLFVSAQQRDAFEGVFSASAGIGHWQAHALGPYRFFVRRLALAAEMVDLEFVRDKVIPYFNVSFPNVKGLDLSGCSLLTKDVLKVFKNIRTDALILRNCKNLFKRFNSSGALKLDDRALMEVYYALSESGSFLERVRHVDLRESIVFDPLPAEATHMIFKESKRLATEKNDVSSQSGPRFYKYLEAVFKDQTFVTETLRMEWTASEEDINERLNRFWFGMILSNLDDKVKKGGRCRTEEIIVSFLDRSGEQPKVIDQSLRRS